MKSTRLTAILLMALATAGLCRAQVNVVTFHNDNARTGQNLSETILTPANVNSNSFGRLFVQPVDGQIYAQPLYMSNVAITNQGTHNVVFVVTEHDSVYAFDADSNAGTNAPPLWQVSFINPAASVTTVPNGDISSTAIVPEIGITATPVIDPDSGTIYIQYKTRNTINVPAVYQNWLCALDVGSGAEKFGGPVAIQATVAGTGDGTDGAGNVPLDNTWHMVRPGLMLANGVVYLAVGSHGDVGTYHGWVLGYNARTLQPQSVFNTSPNGTEGAIWQGGDGPAADAAGNVYFITGNGDFNPILGDYGDSVVKLDSSGTNLAVADYFAPYYQQQLQIGDGDFGSGGLILLPDSVGSPAHPHLLVAAGKRGVIYLLDRDNLGQFNSVSDSQVVGTVQATGSYDSPAYFNDALYYAGINDTLKAFPFSGGTLGATATSATINNFGPPGAAPSISANGTDDAIVWAIETDSGHGTAILRAYDATNLATELYSSSQTGGRDNPGSAIKFTTPTIANGKVYIGTATQLTVFGNGVWASPPAITPNGGFFTNSVTVALASTSTNAQVYYTLDGSTPNSGSMLYTGPLTLTNATTVEAVAIIPGGLSSGVTVALFAPESPESAVGGFGGNGTGWTLNGGAVVTNDVLTLTDGQGEEARSAFFNTGQSIVSFTAQFIYQSTAGGEGAAFVVQNSAAGPAAVGSPGGCLGLCGISPSAAVEFNLFRGSRGSGSGTRYAVSGVTSNYTYTAPLDFDSGDPFLVVLRYNGSILKEHLLDLTTGQTFDTQYTADLPDTVGTNAAVIGFTGGTSGFNSCQTISSFSYTLGRPPVGKPVITPNGGAFTNSITVSISSTTPGAALYYTLDGSLPNTNSTLYTAPIVLSQTTILNARAILAGTPASPPAFALFTLNPRNAAVGGFGGGGAGWTLNGGAVVTNDVLTLTERLSSEARSAYFNVPQNISSFSARFVYQSIGNTAGAAFVMQNAPDGPATLSGGAGCLAYCGVAPSAAVEFNLDSAFGGSGTRYATGGDVTDYTSTLPLDLVAGDPIWVALDYDGSLLTENLVDQTAGSTYVATYAANIPATVGGTNTALIGFTGSTGGGIPATQTITGFTFGPYAPYLPTPPGLSVAFSGNQIVISWSTSGGVVVLESTDSLTAPGVWVPVTAQRVLNHGRTSVTVDIGSGNRFYRLRTP